MQPKPSQFSAIVLALLLLAIHSTAQGYRTAGDLPELESVVGERPVRWQGPVKLAISTDGLGETTADKLRDLVVSAANAWSEPACARVPEIDVGASPVEARDSDGVNTVQLVTTDWEARGFDPSAPGSTVVEYKVDRASNPPEVSIVEADLYLNGEHFAFGGTSDKDPSMDSVIAHEMGHVLGLLHPCGTAATPVPGAPNCSDDLHLNEATMHPEYHGAAASLGQDDADGICFLYPQRREASAEFAEAQAPPADMCWKQSPECPVDRSEGDGGVQDAGLPQWFGVACDAGGQCVSGACLMGDQGPAVCTRRCGDNHASCPHGWECSEIDEKDVCVPEDMGCAVAGRRAGVSTGAWLALSLLGLLARAARRRNVHPA